MCHTFTSSSQVICRVMLPLKQRRSHRMANRTTTVVAEPDGRGGQDDQKFNSPPLLHYQCKQEKGR